MSLKLVDGHPEEISGIDALRDGPDAAPGDAGALAAHLAACAPCATERCLGDAFAAARARVDRELERDSDAVARRVAAAAAAALALQPAAAVLPEHLAGAAPGLRSADPAPVLPLSRRPARRFAVRTAVALAALLVVGVAAAAMLASKAGAPALESTGVATPGVAGAVARMAVPPPAPEGASAEAAAASEAPAAQEAAPPSASGSAAGATAESLFARANEARRRGDDAAAIRIYRELRARFPESRESAVAGPLLGQLLLDKGAPDKALSEFDGYLDKDKGGAVTEEALVGRANALMRMGKAPEERAAWQTLLAKYPRTVHAARARQRLAELH